MRGQMEEFDAILTQLTNKLAEKRCESGMEAFNPHEQGYVINHHGSEGDFVERHKVEHVTFSRNFVTVPAVTAGIVHIDAEHTANTRIDVSVRNVTTAGFDFVVAEWWYDTHNYAVNVMWMACSN
ncbi:hypothetical protein BaRGS_00025876 [Batillaria attramentaria]|uniref:H-type lectin domain-containing protein n=1 Tax=Batillaria attramentaria TaxID=370345 RepID=A0ABD0K7E1_9CAEN